MRALVAEVLWSLACFLAGVGTGILLYEAWWRSSESIPPKSDEEDPRAGQ